MSVDPAGHSGPAGVARALIDADSDAAAGVVRRCSARSLPRSGGLPPVTAGLVVFVGVATWWAGNSWVTAAVVALAAVGAYAVLLAGGIVVLGPHIARRAIATALAKPDRFGWVNAEVTRVLLIHQASPGEWAASNYSSWPLTHRPGHPGDGTAFLAELTARADHLGVTITGRASNRTVYEKVYAGHGFTAGWGPAPRIRRHPKPDPPRVTG